MMRVGVAIEETWDFFHEIYADLQAHYHVSLFSPRSFRIPILEDRINQHLFRRNLQSFLRTNDVVFFEWASRLLATATRLPKTCAIVTRLHRYEMYQWADKIDWSKVDQIILVSHAKQQEFAHRFPDQAGKTVMLPESVSLSTFQKQPRSFNGDIGTLCHLTPRKRVYDLVLTFYECLQENPNLHLHIGGDPQSAHMDYYNALCRLVNELGINDKVTFHGRVVGAHNWYGQIDVFVSNSYSEGLQLTPMEAMASGCYCLCHRWDGAEELLPEENLYFSGAELRQKILSYCDLSDAAQQERREWMRHLVCERFDIRQTSAGIRQVIEQAATNMRSV